MKIQDEPWRLERKFILPRASAQAWEAAVRSHPMGYRTLYPPRQINSLYLETLDLQDATAHLRGQAGRYKLRVRWYGRRGGRVKQPVLEIKQKRGRYGRKLRFALPAFEVTPGLTRRDLAKILKSARLPKDIHELCERRPQMFFNRYQRAYYADMEKRFRMTLDTQLEYGRASNGFRMPRRLDRMAGYMVVELKYAAEDEADEDAAIQNIPLRVTRHSKYLTGMLDRLTL